MAEPDACLPLVNPGAIVVSASLSQCAPETVRKTGKSDRAVRVLVPQAARVASAAAVQCLAAGVGPRLLSSQLRRRRDSTAAA